MDDLKDLIVKYREKAVKANIVRITYLRAIIKQLEDKIRGANT